MFRLGLVVNPYAGLGGERALKGSDELSRSQIALSDISLRVTSRIRQFIEALRQPEKIKIITWGGEMGEDYLQGFLGDIQVAGQSNPPTTSRDTIEATRQICARQIDLMLFVGGDGTARDIVDAIEPHNPVIGLPSGVKMQSACFAISPTATARVVDSLIDNDIVDLREQEVRDLDEEAYRKEVIKSKFYGELLVPELGQFVQSTKVGGVEVEDLVIDDIADELDESLETSYFIVGPGTTTAAFMDKRGLDNTLLGFDVVKDDRLVLKDASSVELMSFVERISETPKLILSVIGGQGYLIGRGNQQLSPAILRRIGVENLIVLATKTKLRNLNGRPLLLDTNDPLIDMEWSGYIQVMTGYRDRVMYALSNGLDK